MRLLHGYLFFQPKKNLVVSYSYWKSCLIYQDLNYTIEYHQIYRRQFSFSSFCYYYFYLFSSRGFCFCYIFYLVDSVYVKEIIISFFTYPVRKLRGKRVLPLKHLVCISCLSFHIRLILLCLLGLLSLSCKIYCFC